MKVSEFISLIEKNELFHVTADEHLIWSGSRKELSDPEYKMLKREIFKQDIYCVTSGWSDEYMCPVVNIVL